MYGVAVIGAGVVGAAVARVLSQYDARVALIDSSEDVGTGATRANSAIVHAGYDSKVGSLDALLCIKGNKAFGDWCGELDVPFKRIGSLVLGFDEADGEEIRRLYDNGVRGGVPGLRIISGSEAREIEPCLNPEVHLALYAPSAGITSPYEFAIACAENARDNGCDWLMDFRVDSIERRDGEFAIASGEREIRARCVVNAAGLYSDEIARMIGDKSFKITPRKGEYMVLDREAKGPKTVIFQTPSKLGKGVLVAPTVDGNVLVGPTAVNQRDKADSDMTDEGFASLASLSCRSVPDIDLRRVIRSFAGVRAQPSRGKFIVRQSRGDALMIQAAGICSPGLTSSPAIAEMVAGIVRGAGVKMDFDGAYRARRKAIPAFRSLGGREREGLIKSDARYGRVICRCESVTEGEIVEAVRRGARSLDGVKRRTRAGMGRCQSGFCGPRIMQILERELGEPMEGLTKFGGGSNLLARKGVASNE